MKRIESAPGKIKAAEGVQENPWQEVAVRELNEIISLLVISFIHNLRTKEVNFLPHNNLENRQIVFYDGIGPDQILAIPSNR